MFSYLLTRGYCAIVVTRVSYEVNWYFWKIVDALLAELCLSKNKSVSDCNVDRLVNALSFPLAC